MKVKHLIIIGALAVAVAASAIIVPIAIKNSLNNDSKKDMTIDDIKSDDNLGEELQTKLTNSYQLYFDNCISSSTGFKLKDEVFLSVNAQLAQSKDSEEKIYVWSDNSGYWDEYKSVNVSLTPVVEPQTIFGEFYIYYQAQ